MNGLEGLISGAQDRDDEPEEDEDDEAPRRLHDVFPFLNQLAWKRRARSTSRGSVDS
ncbi:MAG: hypothetical protein ACLS3C_11000 [Oscillospiraceae bacterium]